MNRRLVPMLLATAVGASLVVSSLVVAPAPADAASAKTPARPHGERVAAVGRHTIVVSLPALKNAKRYRLYVSIRRGDLTIARSGHAQRSASATRPRLTVGTLPYTSSRYYFRVRVSNGGRSRWGNHIGSVALRPAAPTSLRVTSSSGGTWLTWHGAATGYQVVQARNAALTSAARGFTLRGTTGQFTPYGTTPGRTFFYRVRTINNGTPSSWSPTVHVVIRSRLQPLRLMTYNVLTSATDGTKAGDGVVAPWARRRVGVLALITRAAPDVLCLQEGGGWVGSPQGYGGRRQVDDLQATLGGYTLARTETPPGEHHYQRFGNYVLYRTSTYRPLAAGGHWDLGDGRTAAYQLLQHRGSGARLLAVSVHLDYGAGKAADDRRAVETRRLVAQAATMARRVHAPVVYAGDFNSVVNKNHVYDGPATVLRTTGVVDAQHVAQTLTNADYNSANLYSHTPPRVGQSIDYVYAPPGVAISTRAVLLDLRNGRFPGVIPSDHNPLLINGAYPY